MIAVGGPLDGLDVPCRFPRGLVLGNKPAGQVLIYDRHADRLVARTIQAQDETLILRAANEDRYDVLAYDRERMGPWQR